MRILAIDDQQLILLSIEKHLTNLGYEVETATSVEQGIQAYNSFDPDLVVLDMNMPEMAGTNLIHCTGTEVVKYIRLFLKRNTPILVMSGNTNTQVIAESLSLSVNDYIAKPISLEEMTSRIHYLSSTDINKGISPYAKSGDVIEKNCVGVVIPCHNNEEALLDDCFRNLVERHINYHYCFVNYGSTDNTLQVLYELRQGNESNTTIINCGSETGKSNAIRMGMLHLSKEPQYSYIGFLASADYDDFKYFNDLVGTLGNSSTKALCKIGSSTVFKNRSRKHGTFISRAITKIIRSVVLNIPKDFWIWRSHVKRRDVVDRIFKKEFRTDRMMDIEIAMRMKKLHNRNGLLHRVQRLLAIAFVPNHLNVGRSVRTINRS